MTLRAAATAALVLSLAACGGSDAPAAARGDASMRPGENCLTSGCHTAFSAAGTVFASASGTTGLANATVVIDGSLQRVEMSTNGAGNFWTTVNFGSGPVTVNGRPMTMHITAFSTGGCAAAACHASSRVHP